MVGKWKRPCRPILVIALSPLSLSCVWVGGGETAATTEQKIYYDSSNLMRAPQMDTCHPAHARGWVPGLVILHVAVVVVVGAVGDAPAVVRHADDGVHKKSDRVVQPLACAKALVAAAARLTGGYGWYDVTSNPNSPSIAGVHPGNDGSAPPVSSGATASIRRAPFT